MARKRKKIFKHLEVGPFDNERIRQIVDAFKTIPWQHFDLEHEQCIFTSDTLCFFCCLRSICQRLMVSHGPKSVTPTELAPFVHQFPIHESIHDAIQYTLTIMLNEFEQLKQHFLLNFICSKCEHEWCSSDLGLYLNDLPNLNLEIPVIVENVLLNILCPSCQERGCRISESRRFY